MLNKKLKTIASLIDKNDTVLDIGCDHAYLAIYLKQNNLCKIENIAINSNSNASGILNFIYDIFVFGNSCYQTFSFSKSNNIINYYHRNIWEVRCYLLNTKIL